MVDWESALNRKYRRKLTFVGSPDYRRSHIDPKEAITVAVELLDTQLRHPSCDVVVVTREVSYYDVDSLPIDSFKTYCDRVMRIPYHFHSFLLCAWSQTADLGPCYRYLAICCVKADFSQEW